ncbi:MAG: alanine--tRNA ligase [Planctomycetota bacterium]|jgi:alanyl-tRNA synthetase
MTPDQIREAYLAFFERREHSRHPSDSLVPTDDPTLLFTGAGMNQFKAMFLGKGHLPFRRATTTQKCLRMPDLENVGRTASHHTFFEMLGNFSFGDYFKEEAIRWAWEFLDAELQLPMDRLSVTVYTDDDEAAGFWIDGVGLPAERVFRCGEEDNFWPASAPSQGPNGICGPCSEIYYDFHPERGPIPPEGPSTDGDRFVEIWNLVFTQFDRRDGGELVPLPQRNIDTGMGFERVVRVVESVAADRVLPSNFDTTLFRPMLDAIHAHVGRETTFGTPEGTRVRRIADHVRAAVFCIVDGVRPSNVKQGYVVRKVLRRAMLDRHALGGDLRTPWLAALADVVAETMGTAWPELNDARSVCASTIAAEEEKFAGAFLSGSQRLSVLAEQVRAGGGSQLEGRAAFLLYDTFGLPLDLQKMLLTDQGLDVDEDGFRIAMAEQRRRSRESSRLSEQIFDEGPLASVGNSLPATVFVREGLELDDVSVLAVVDDGEAEPDSEQAERRVIVVLDRTPFYAESGGQVGDAGWIEGPSFRVDIDDTVSLRGITLHRGVVAEGHPVPGPATARVDPTLRAATARNHTATHVLHSALREILGDEVTQAGSLVAPDRLRFDFRFPRAMTDAELAAVEDRVNAWVLDNQTVQSTEVGREEARRQGAMALFGEKYGDVVRVVRVPDRARGQDSVELCGGTHVVRSGDIGLVRIVSEGSVAAGIRRIEARTGTGLMDLLREADAALKRSAALFKTSPDHLEERISGALEDLKATRRELEALRERTARETLLQSVRDQDGLRVLVTVVEGLPIKPLREMCGELVRRECDLVMLALPEDGATHYLVAVGKPAQDRGFDAKELVGRLAKALGGKGGGNKGFAQGRGGTHDDLPAVLRSTLEASAAAGS